MADREGTPEPTAGRGIKPRTILAPILAWLIVAVVVAVYVNQRGKWKSLAGQEAYVDCFGSPPADGLRLLNAASFRHYRYSGEMLAMECYAEAEGRFDSSGTASPGGVQSGVQSEAKDGPESDPKGHADDWTDAEGWRDAPLLGGNLGLQSRLDGRKLTRVPQWLLNAELPDSARVREDDRGRWLYVHAIGTPRLLIAGGWLTKAQP